MKLDNVFFMSSGNFTKGLVKAVKALPDVVFCDQLTLEANTDKSTACCLYPRGIPYGKYFFGKIRVPDKATEIVVEDLDAPESVSRDHGSRIHFLFRKKHYFLYRSKSDYQGDQGMVPVEELREGDVDLTDADALLASDLTDADTALTSLGTTQK